MQTHAVLQRRFSTFDVVFKTGTLALQKCSPKYPCSTDPSLPLHFAWHFAHLGTRKARREVERAERGIAPENWPLSSNAIPQLMMLVKRPAGSKEKAPEIAFIEAMFALLWWPNHLSEEERWGWQPGTPHGNGGFSRRTR